MMHPGEIPVLIIPPIHSNLNLLNGLTTAGCSSIGATGQEILLKLSKTASLSGVKNLYFNVGWSFPSLTDSNVIELTKFLDNGGNMMISGQDIGWETWNTTTPYGTTATKNFFTNYLNASWNADGGSTNSTLRAVTTDAIYGNVPVFWYHKSLWCQSR